MKIEALELKRENAEANLLNASPEDRLVYVSLLNSATAELTRLGQKESDLRQKESDLLKKEQSLALRTIF